MAEYKTFRDLFEAWGEDSPELFDHEFIWYVSGRLTMEQWIQLDVEMGDAFERAGISLDDVVGVAGPIPYEEKEEEESDGEVSD